MPLRKLIPDEPVSTIAGGAIEILYADSNWALQVGYGTNQIYWRSRIDGGAGETATGKIRIGYFNLKSKLTMPMAGGGATNGNLKVLRIIRASDSFTLATYTLSTLLGGANYDSLKIAVIDTSLWVGVNCLLEIDDIDSNSAWAWIGFSLSEIYCY